jgi:hypothetical protein
MAGKNDQRLVAVRQFACCPQARPREKPLPFVIVENCSLVINAYFSQQYYMQIIE